MFAQPAAITLVLVLSMPIAAEANDVPNAILARGIAERALAIFSEIDDLQLRFRSVMRPRGKVDAKHERKYEQGVYAFRRGQFELIRFQEVREGHDPIDYAHVLTPTTLHSLREDIKRGDRLGAFKPANAMNFRLHWAPAKFVPVAVFQDRLALYVARDEYLVRLSGTDSRVELVVPVRKGRSASSTQRQGAAPKREVHDIYYLSQEKAFATERIEHYRNGERITEIVIDLEEIVPGVWLAAHGICTQFTSAGEGLENGVESECWIEPGSVQLNKGLAESFFQLTMPKGTVVEDHITKVRYIEGIQGGGHRKDLTTISQIGRQLAPTVPVAALPPRRRSSGERPLLLTAASLAAVSGAVIGGVLLWRQRST